MSSWVHDDKVLFSRLGVDEAVKRSFSVYTNRLGVFLPIGIMQAFPALILTWGVHSMANKLAQSANPTAANSDWNDPYAAQANAIDVPDLRNDIAAISIGLFLSSFLMMIAAGANIRATGEVYARKEPSLIACLQEGFNRFCDLFLFGIILFFGIMIGSLAFGFAIGIFIGIFNAVVGSDSAATVLLAVVSGACYFFVYLYVAISFQITPPSIVVERKSPIEAMKRSWKLIEGRRIYVFCAIFLLSLLNIVVGFFCGLVLGPVAPLVSGIWNAVAMPVSSILGAVLFFSVRVEKEGFNREALVTELGYSGGVAVATMIGGSGDYKPVKLDSEDSTEVV